MMESARENMRADRFPVATAITADRAHIDAEIAHLSALSPALSGGIDALQVDHRPIADDDRIPNILRDGTEEYLALLPGMLVQIVQGTVARDWLITAKASEDCVRLRIPFDGQATFSSPQDDIHDGQRFCTFIVQSAGTGLTGTYRRGTRYRFCSLEISRDYLESGLGFSLSDLPPMLSRLWRNREVSFGHIPLDRRTRLLAERLFNLDRRAAWRPVQAHMIGLELLKELFDAWTATAQAATGVQRLTPEEHDVLLRLGREVERRCPAPIALSEAVSFTGINRNKLQFMFKRMFGMSLQQYCTELRMRRALDLLNDAGLSIADVAERLGFSEATNFTAAFKKHFSVPPSAMRQGG